jgi:hypothetical protein
VRDHEHSFFTFSDAQLQAGECLWRLSVPARSAALSLPGRQFVSWQGAERWWRGHAPAKVMRAAAPGHAVLVRGADKQAGVFAPLPQALHRVHVELKRSFDPKRLFNLGRMYADL